jgi:ubiquinone/menaquinone biosynthesis C-methylase UbiE
MDAAAYDAWYETARGRWIGETEYRLLHRVLAPAAGDSLLDVGCGSGYFTRRFAQDNLRVTGIDPDVKMLCYAAAHAAAGERYLLGDARTLPFPARAFDLCVCITALCFIPEQSRALAEMVRVTRRRLVLGLLNRHSLLYLQKGRAGGTGAYRGAHWHTPAEMHKLFERLPVARLALRSAIFLPGGDRFAQLCEQVLPSRLPWGSFLVVSADVAA